MSHERIIDLYERHAHRFDRDRGRTLQERPWLDAFVGQLRPGGRVLDIGCGTGEPIARHLIESGVELEGIDSSPSMIEICRRRFPSHSWHVGDMRGLALDRRFDGLLAWDSFFHLSMADQRGMFQRFAGHAAPGAVLMFTSGASAGEAIGAYQGEPLYHASLSQDEYRQLLAEHGFTVRQFVEDDVACGNHTVWLAVHDGPPGAGRNGTRH